MTNTICRICFLAYVAGSAIAADAPYIGKWKLNPSKSQLTGETVTVEKLADGAIRQHQGDITFTFKLDGKEYPLPGGGTAAWKVADPNTWDRVDRTNGKVTVKSRLKLEGDIVSITFHLIKPDGSSLDGDSKWKRVSGGAGFFGTFESTEQNAVTRNIEFGTSEADALTIKFLDSGAFCAAKFDGQDYPLTGPFENGRETFNLKRTGPQSVEITAKLDGKPVSIDKFSVSADGKTLTDIGTPTTKKEITTAVFDRQ